jgi:CubicO group peptidase (beta-lactamase class C family)
MNTEGKSGNYRGDLLPHPKRGSRIMNRSVRRTAAAVLFALTVPMTSSARQVQGSLAEQIDARFEHFTSSSSPGLALVVVQNGEVVLRRGYGLANLEHQIPITPSTVFDIASVSKQFTGLAISILVEEGRIGLDTPLLNYVPGKLIEQRMGHSMEEKGFRKDWLDLINNQCLSDSCVLDTVHTSVLRYSNVYCN